MGSWVTPEAQGASEIQEAGACSLGKTLITQCVGRVGRTAAQP